MALTDHLFPQNGDEDYAVNFAQLTGQSNSVDYVESGFAFDPDYTTPSVTVAEGIAYLGAGTQSTPSDEQRSATGFVVQAAQRTITLATNAVNYVYVTPSIGADDTITVDSVTNTVNIPTPALQLGTVDTNANTYTETNRDPDADFESVTITGGQNLPDDVEITLGTDDDYAVGYDTASDALNVTDATGTTQLSVSDTGVTVSGDLTINGEVNLTSSDIQNNTIQLSTASGLTGGGSVLLGGSRTIQHENTSSQSNVSASAESAITSIALDSFGHVTSISTSSFDSRYLNASGDSLNGNSLTDVGDLVFNNIESLSGTEGQVGYDASEGLLLHDGSSHRVIVDGENLNGGSQITVTGGTGAGGSPITVAHTNVSAASGTSTSGGTVIDKIFVDQNGHTTSVGTRNLDNRYYTQSEVETYVANNTATATSAENATFADTAGNANKLDGHHASYFTTLSEVNNNADVPNADYADNAGDADTLDGHDASHFTTLSEVNNNANVPNADYADNAGTASTADNLAGGWDTNGGQKFRYNNKVTVSSLSNSVVLDQNNNHGKVDTGSALFETGSRVATRNWVNNNSVPNADHADTAGDADTLDGHDATFFTTLSEVNNNANVPNADHADTAGDADTLDGHDASYFTTLSEVNNNADVPNADYADNAGDADTLDGNHANHFTTLSEVNSNADVPNADHADQANTAQQADNAAKVGGSTVYVQTSQPSNPTDGDIWISY